MAEYEREEADIARLASEKALSLAAVDHARWSEAVVELEEEREKLQDTAGRYPHAGLGLGSRSSP